MHNMHNSRLRTCATKCQDMDWSGSVPFNIHHIIQDAGCVIQGVSLVTFKEQTRFRFLALVTEGNCPPDVLGSIPWLPVSLGQFCLGNEVEL